MIDMKNGVCKTVGGNGTAGFADSSFGKSQLSEPSGIAHGSDNTIFVSDTNNNLIRVFLIQEETLQTLDLKNIPKPRVSPLEVEDALDVSVPSHVIVTDEATTKQGTININLSFDRGFGFTKGAVSSFVSRFVGLPKDNSSDVSPSKGAIDTKELPNIQLKYKLDNHAGPGTKIQIDCKIHYREEGQECLIQDTRVEVPFGKITSANESTIDITVKANNTA
eukprot:g9017.t1